MQYTITENLDDHQGYLGQPVSISKELYDGYYIVEDARGNTWFCDEYELTLIN